MCKLSELRYDIPMDIEHGHIFFEDYEKNIINEAGPIPVLSAPGLARQLRARYEVLSRENVTDSKAFPNLYDMRRRHFAARGIRHVLKGEFTAAKGAVQQVINPDFEKVKARQRQRSGSMHDLSQLADGLSSLYEAHLSSEERYLFGDKANAGSLAVLAADLPRFPLDEPDK